MNQTSSVADDVVPFDVPFYMHIQEPQQPTLPTSQPVEGIKHDEGKTRWDLLPWDGVEGVAKIMTWGAKTYGADNWKDVKNGPARYFAALMRHLMKYLQGESLDPDTGCTHLEHVATNALFINYLTRKDSGND